MFHVLFEDRSRAESFGAVADLYDRVRPGYPPALFDQLLAPDTADVLDVGCGTGIVGVLLAARGCSVLGVEIDERMARRAHAKGLAVEVAAFERWDDAGRRFDLITSGQAWHWIEPRAGAIKAASVLRAGGRIGVFWNLGDPPPELRRRLMPIYEQLEPGLEDYSVVLGAQSDRDGETAAALADSELFGDISVSRFPWLHGYDRASWLAFLETHSDHQTLPPPRRERLLSAVGDAIDELGGSFEISYEAVLVSARRL
jgi:SAM-dependent methyltransferase